MFFKNKKKLFKPRTLSRSLCVTVVFVYNDMESNVPATTLLTYTIDSVSATFQLSYQSDALHQLLYLLFYVFFVIVYPI